MWILGLKGLKSLLAQLASQGPGKSNKMRSGPCQAKCESCLPKGQAGIQLSFRALLHS